MRVKFLAHSPKFVNPGRDTFNCLTARKKHGVGSIDDDTEIYSWSDIPRHRLMTLGEAGVGIEFDSAAQPRHPSSSGAE